MTDAHSHSDQHGHDHDHGGVGKYLAVFLALCVLTGASFFTCSSAWPFKDTPSIGWAFMMAVSCTKAMLVILFFMHLIWEANWKYILTIPAAMMSVFLVCMLIPDVGRRTVYYAEERQLFAAERVEHHGHGDAHSEDDHGEDGHGENDHSEDGHGEEEQGGHGDASH